ncbi:MAG: hypothetical protein AAF467_15000 [Actinomycetota bacterium]
MARLFRAARGNRSLEAAIVLLAETDVVTRLECCITVDSDRDMAWLDWHSAARIAERLSERERAVVVLASAVAAGGEHVTGANSRAVRLAFDHLVA